jgi:mono/diheme cytochrome c family protein
MTSRGLRKPDSALAGLDPTQGTSGSAGRVSSVGGERRRKNMRSDRLASGLLAILAGVAMADAARAADAYNGGQIARRWCEPCHVVAGDQRGTTGEAPPFASIATRPGFDAGQLAVFLLDPHPKMPNMSLTRIEAGDLAAYIASLGK